LGAPDPAEGLDEDKIMEILEEWQCEKMCRNFREKESQPRQEITDPHRRSPNGISLAASRQAKAKKVLSFGPSDKEIVDVLQDYSKENLTPPQTQHQMAFLWRLVAKPKRKRYCHLAPAIKKLLMYCKIIRKKI
jgi:hypothetical protein